MAARTRIALIAHDEKKDDMVAFVVAHGDFFAGCDIVATGTTGGRVAEACPGLAIRRLKSGPLGGDQQIGALIAEGAIDAVIFLLTSLTERARGLALLKALHRAPDRADAIIREALPPMVAGTMDEQDFAKLRRRLALVSAPPTTPKLGRDDYLAALGIFFLVFLATFPVVIPFLFIGDALTALRVSNAVALVMLFLAGYSFGLYAQHRPLLMGFTMMFIGSVLVAITIALGG